jgi:hypothetical protein
MSPRLPVRTCLVALVFAMAMTVNASAGKYHVYSCRMPSGAAAPADGWAGSVKGPVSDVLTIDSCASGGALIAAMGEEATHAYGDKATWQLTVPSPEKMISATLWRASRMHFRSGESGVYEAWLSGPNENEIFDECIPSLLCNGEGEVGNPFASSNEVAVPSSHLGATLQSNVDCFAFPESSRCGTGFGDPNGYASAQWIYAANLIMEQTQIPAAGTPSGPLATETPVHGTSDLIFTATDAGAGIYKAIFTVDEKVVQETVINEDEGRCRNVGETSDGLPAFLYLQPCSKEVSADVGLNTEMLTNGLHHLIVSVTDAAGNSAYVLDREIDVVNKYPPEFRWRVNGMTLAEGHSKEFTAKAATAGAKKTMVIKGKVSGTSIKVESSRLKVVSGATILGGLPGTANETLKLENVTVAKPTHCEIKEGTIITTPLVNEIVESAEEEKKVKVGTEKAELLFAPKEGGAFAEISFAGSECSLKGTTAILDGSIAGETLPQKEQSEAVGLRFEKASKSVYKTSKGTFGVAELTMEGKDATLEGEAEMTLTGKEKFGAF